MQTSHGLLSIRKHDRKTGSQKNGKPVSWYRSRLVVTLGRFFRRRHFELPKVFKCATYIIFLGTLQSLDNSHLYTCTSLFFSTSIFQFCTLNITLVVKLSQHNCFSLSFYLCNLKLWNKHCLFFFSNSFLPPSPFTVNRYNKTCLGSNMLGNKTLCLGKGFHDIFQNWCLKVFFYFLLYLTTNCLIHA